MHSCSLWVHTESDSPTVVRKTLYYCTLFGLVGSIDVSERVTVYLPFSVRLLHLASVCQWGRLRWAAGWCEGYRTVLRSCIRNLYEKKHYNMRFIIAVEQCKRFKKQTEKSLHMEAHP